jgi:hypothetical protein
MGASSAGFKLRRALLRVAVLHPEGFTAKQLSDASGVDTSTARDFLKPSSSNVFVREANQGHPNGPYFPRKRGRPENYYVLTPAGRGRILEEVLRVQRQLRGVDRSRKHVFRSLERLLETLNDIDSAGKVDRLDLFETAEVELKICLIEAKTLQRTNSAFNDEYLEVLKRAVGMLEMKRMSVSGLSDSYHLSFDDLAKCPFVSATRAREAIIPLLIALDTPKAERIVGVVHGWTSRLGDDTAEVDRTEWCVLLAEIDAIISDVYPNGGYSLWRLQQSLAARSVVSRRNSSLSATRGNSLHERNGPVMDVSKSVERGETVSTPTKPQNPLT